jgi:Flp pilus assembly protein TadB
MSAVNWSLAGGLAAIVTGLFILAVAMFGSLARSGEERDLADRIARYGPRHLSIPVSNDAAAAGKVGRVAVDVTQRLMSPAAQRRLSDRLELGAVARKPTEWVLLGCGVAFVVAAALSIVTGYIPLGVLVGALVGWITMRLWLSVLIRRRRGAFGEQLPDLLQLVASALQSGFSLPQALDAVVREDAQPAAGEFARALTEARLGGDLEDCLETVADRMASDDLRWTVMAIRIQRRIGGNLAEVLTTTASTIRERGFLRRQVHALSAEGRLSAYVLIALPIAVAGFLFVFNPKYMRPLYTTGVGELMLAGAIVLLVLGMVIMRQMIKLDI